MKKWEGTKHRNEDLIRSGCRGVRKKHRIYIEG